MKNIARIIRYPAVALTAFSFVSVSLAGTCAADGFYRDSRCDAFPIAQMATGSTSVAFTASPIWAPQDTITGQEIETPAVKVRPGIIALD